MPEPMTLPVPSDAEAGGEERRHPARTAAAIGAFFGVAGLGCATVLMMIGIDGLAFVLVAFAVAIVGAWVYVHRTIGSHGWLAALVAWVVWRALSEIGQAIGMFD